jgi:hypothetical protein
MNLSVKWTSVAIFLLIPLYHDIIEFIHCLVNSYVCPCIHTPPPHFQPAPVTWRWDPQCYLMTIFLTRSKRLALPTVLPDDDIFDPKQETGATNTNSLQEARKCLSEPHKMTCAIFNRRQRRHRLPSHHDVSLSTLTITKTNVPVFTLYTLNSFQKRTAQLADWPSH